MVSSDELRLLSSLSDNRLQRFEPTIDDTGQVDYPEASELLTIHSDDPIQSLDLLSEMNLLNKEYTIKVYVCPSCQTEGMQYITACPNCESTHSVHTSFRKHNPCGHVAQSSVFETDYESDEYHCPNCESQFGPDEFSTEQRHLCKDCETSFVTPDHRLWCRDCRHFCAPDQSQERTLYEYFLSDRGEDWYETQQSARQLLADEFDSRGFAVEIDVDLPQNGDESFPVHIYAEDTLLDQKITVDVHSVIDTDNIEYINTVAQQVGAKPLILTTDTSISDEVSSAAERREVTILWIDSDGSITRLEGSDASQPNSNIVERLTSVFEF